MLSRFSISILLLVAIFPSVMGFTAYPQQVITYTSTVAFTTSLTMTSTSTTLQQQSLHTGIITLAPASGPYTCQYTGKKTASDFPGLLDFTANHNDRIIGSFSSDSPIDFFVVTESFFNQWGAIGRASDCSPVGTPDQTLVAKLGVTSLSIDFTVNWDGKYRFIFVNFDRSKTAHIDLKWGLAGSITTKTPS